MKTLLWLCCCFCMYFATAQTAETIIADLRSVNNSVTNMPCSTGKGNVISNRAMNIFLSNKMGTYLSSVNDLSLYKNSVIFNTAQGTFSVLHSTRQAKGTDEPVKSSFFIGAKANVLNSFAAAVNRRHIINDFGILLSNTWMGKTKTSFSPCTGRSFSMSQKQSMDALRASLVNLLAAEIKLKDSLFEKSLTGVVAAQIPGQNLDSAKANLRKRFYTLLNEEYSRKFAEQQSETLIETNNYNLISTSWTTIGAYLPVMRERMYVANSLTSNFITRHLYPVEISVTHTRFWESTKAGRLFIKLNAAVFANNSFHSKALQSLTLATYKAMGGTDTLHIIQQNSDELFTGSYRNFFTPQLCASVVYIPVDSHIGISASAEQNFGSYKALNGTLGVPVVLITKKGDPAVTFEFQVLFFDIGNRQQPQIKLGDKTAVDVNIGIPFSKIVY